MIHTLDFIYGTVPHLMIYIYYTSSKHEKEKEKEKEQKKIDSNAKESKTWFP